MTRNWDTPLEITLGDGEPTRVRWMDVIQDMDQVDSPLDGQ